MDDLYETHLPRIVGSAVLAHNSDVNAHAAQIAAHTASCPTAKRFDRFRFLLIGLAAGGGVLGGTVISKLLALL